MGDPNLLRTYDCLGNRLDLGIEEMLNREANWVDTGYGRATSAEFNQGRAVYEVPAFFESGTDPADPARWAELLEMGAAGRLLISGELEDVLRLEDADALEKAKPILPSGGVKLDPVKIEARRDAHMKLALKDGPVAMIVLGGAHDLTASVRRFGGECEYLRVTTSLFREIGG